MQSFTHTAIVWVGLVGVRLVDFQPRKGWGTEVSSMVGVWGVITPLIFPLNSLRMDSHTGPYKSSNIRTADLSKWEPEGALGFRDRRGE